MVFDMMVKNIIVVIIISIVVIIEWVWVMSCWPRGLGH